MTSEAYPAVHQRLRRTRGRAAEQQCALCEHQAEHWAYDKSDPVPLTAIVQGHRVTYSADLERYMPLCGPCHRLLDRPPKTHCVNGHELTPDNIYTRPNGGRLCRRCKRETQRAWRAANPGWREGVSA